MTTAWAAQRNAALFLSDELPDGSHFLRRVSVAMGLIVWWCWLVAGGGPVSAEVVTVTGTEFRVVGESGEVLSDQEAVGAVFTIADDAGNSAEIRIDEVFDDLDDPDREIKLYRLSERETPDAAWVNVCPPDAKGLSAAFPLTGTWTSAGAHVKGQRFLLTCTSGAIAKCARMYKPWKSEQLWQMHQACTRAIREDYCGDGSSFTNNAIQIDVYDVFDIEKTASLAQMTFEAAWNTDGAVCLRRVRVPEVATVADVLAHCPGKLEGKVGGICSEESALSNPGTLLLNKSPTTQ